MEVLLHYAWKHKILPLKELKSTLGKTIEIIDPGLYNKDSGPDFFNAKIKIDGILWVGNVEIHQNTSDWYKHGHHKNPIYDSIILHVAENVDGELLRSDGGIIPQIQLQCPDNVINHYKELIINDCYPPCYKIIPSLSSFFIHNWMNALQIERLEEKSNLILERWKKCEKNWEKTFFVTLARNYGFGINGEIFERWSSHVSLNATAKYRNDLFKIEAIFFGQAGLLDEKICDTYYQKLQKEYQYLSYVFDLKKMETHLWRFMRLRPTNFPYIRIAQLAWIYYERQGLFSKLMECCTLSDIYNCLNTQTSEYWETHYIFGKESPKCTKHMSKNSQNLIIINTITPLLFTYGKHSCNEELCQRALTLMDRLKAENNYITRMWNQCGLEIKNAGDSQALIQLKKEYCDKKKCLYCRIGFEYLKRK